MAKPSRGDAAAPTDSDADKAERKKLRNRLSQRAFRRRRAEHLRELQHRAAVSESAGGNGSGSGSGSDRLVALEDENRRLRAHVTQLQSQLEGIQASLQLMARSSASILKTATTGPTKESGSNQEGVASAHEVGVRGEEAQRDQPECSAGACHGLPWLGHADDGDHVKETSSLVRASSRMPPPPFTVDGMGPALNFDGLVPGVPDFWTPFPLAPYTDALELSLAPPSLVGVHCVESNSPFSDHIQLLKALLKAKLKQPRRVDRAFSQTLYQSVSSALAMFNSITRPDVMTWYAKTRFFHIVELTAWQVSPSPATYARLSERYRPTATQMAMQGRYPSVVDWIPFASVRDRAIRLHAANPRIDALFCDAVSGYVVESTMSELVAGTAPIRVYVRVTDLIATMALDRGESGQGQDEGVLPAPDVETLFSSPAHAQLAFAHLRMDCGAQEYKMDPAFFGRHPELCDPGDEAILASGVPLRPARQTTLTSPRRLDPVTMAVYSSFINFSVDAARAFSKRAAA